MRYLLILLLFVGCAGKPKKPPVEKAPAPKFKERHERLLNCVDRYLEQDVKIHEAFEVCKGIFKRG